MRNKTIMVVLDDGLPLMDGQVVSYVCFISRYCYGKCERLFFGIPHF